MSNGERARFTRHDGAIVAMMVAFAALTLWLALARYHSVHNRTFDLALYARMAWGLAHGQLWDPIVSGSFLGGHAPFVLLPLGLLGALFGTVPVLLTAQSVLVAATAWPLSRIALRHLGATPALIVAAAWLLYPNPGHVTTYEFHPGNLALLPMAAALDALDDRRPRALLWCCLAVVACRVSLALQTGLIGLLALHGASVLRASAAPPATGADHGAAAAPSPSPAPGSPAPGSPDLAASMRRVGLIVTLASLGYFLLSLQVLHPAFGGAAEASMALHFGHLGGSPFGVVRALLTAPGQVLEHFIARERLVYLPLVLGPLALLPLARPALVLVALPPLALNLLSQFPTATQLYSHYLTPALPPLFVGAVLALSGRPRPGRRSGLLMLCATTLIATLLWGGLPWSRDFAAADFRDDPRSAAHRRLLARIEPGRPVQAPDALLPHLAERRRVHRAPPPERETGLVVLDLGHRRRFAAREVLLRTAEEPLARTWLARTDHGVIDAAGDLVLLERGADPRAGVARRYLLDGPNYGAAARLTGCLEITLGLLEPRQLSLLLRALGPCPEDLAVRLGTGAAPPRVDLLFDGLLSPAHLRAGDSLRSVHAISGAERRAIGAGGLRVGALRSSGARPAPADPIAVDVRVVWPPTSAPAARVPLRPEPASRSDEARLP